MSTIPPDHPNAELAAAVEAALTMVETQGVRTAAAYLASRGAGVALTCRVLSEPGRQRQLARLIKSKG